MAACRTGSVGRDQLMGRVTAFLQTKLLGRGVEGVHAGLCDVATGDQPLLVLFEEQGPDEPRQGCAVGEDGDHACAALQLPIRDVTLLDVRPEQEFAEAHLPGALSVPLPLLESRLGELPRDRTIIAYCRGPFCTFSAEAVRRLRELGFDARRSDVSVHSLDATGVPA